MRFLNRKFILIFILFSVLFCLSYIFKITNETHFSFSIKYEYLVLALIPQILFFIILSLAWQFIVSVIAKKKINIINCFIQNSWVLIGKYIPGKIWGMTARLADSSSYKISLNDGIYCTYIEQLINVYSGLFIAAAAYAYYYYPAYVIYVILMMLIIGQFIIILNRQLFSLFTKISKRINSVFEYDQYHIATNQKFILITTSYYMLGWFFSGSIFILLVNSVYPQFSIDHVPLMIAMNIMAFISGFLAIFVPAGLGVREAYLVAGLSTIIPIEHAVAVAILYRLWVVIFDLLSALFSVAVIKVYK